MEALFAIGILIIGILFVLRLIMGHRVFSQFIGDWLFEISKAIITLPFKIISYILRFFK